MTNRIEQARADQSLTDWSMVLDAGRIDSPSRSTSLDRLVRRYWPPLFAYVRATGCSPQEANDVVQGFIADVILERNLPGSADRDRGRFRGLLFRSIGNYLKDRHRRETSLKRRPAAGRPTSIDVTDPGMLACGDRDTPERSFTRHWVATLLRRAVETVRSSFLDSQRETEWMILESRLVRPMLDGSDPVPYASLVESLGLRDVPQAAAYLVNGKRALGRAILDEIGETVPSPGQVDSEARDLLRLLSERTP
ncbi:MAG: hypothetical protein CMJ52_06530 [Planctomycetaceae bacterium]|nr:hypothetical protein [Planctomycetaceae bacterium]